MSLLFRERKIVIATKHHKEKVIEPLLRRELELNCVLAEDLDTDVFGTFTGEIERLRDPVETARQKCIRAMEISGCDMAIANEGSFGLHPTILFAPADSEIVLFMDRQNNFEFVVREISTSTNFDGKEITSYAELRTFAQSVLFPSHGLILRKSQTSKEEIYKGIVSETELEKVYHTLMNKYGSVYAETDMRALYNPTRMKVIEKAVQKLILKIKTRCPECEAPGFSVAEAKPGLKCQDCGSPTRSTLFHVLSCSACGYKQERMYPHGKVVEEPMYCDLCNP